MTKSKNTAQIFDIQRASFVDGPGMRTTIFFKGCNLNCKWCHNPEGICKDKQLLFYEEKCSSCGVCKNACPFSLEQCDLCGACALVCPNEARVLCGSQYTVEQLLDVVSKDELFYKTSNGGVTLSGGECMLQVDFIKEFLIELKKKGIHVAIDTAGNLPFSQFEKIIDYVDLFLYDIKFISSNLHRQYTSVDNRLILDNLKKLIELKKEVIIRIPVIAMVNDDIAEMKKISSFLKEIGYSGKVELLPYHNMGENKCKALGKKFDKFNAPSKEKMQQLSKLFD